MKAIRKIISRRALERWEMKIGNCDVILYVIRPIALSLKRRDGPKSPSAIYSPSDPLQKDKTIAVWKITSHPTTTTNDRWKREFKPCSML
jgi:hypothetical protein